MKLGKKAKRGTRVKKLFNGGNGDPTKAINGDPVKESVASPELAPEYSDELSLDYLDDIATGRLEQNPLTGAFELGAAVLGGAAKAGYQYVAGPLARLMSKPLVGSNAPAVLDAAGKSIIGTLPEVTLGEAITAGGVGISAELLPEHVKDFAEEPTFGGAALIGLDVAAMYPLLSSSLRGYSNFLKAKQSVSASPITLSSGPAFSTEQAVTALDVQDARTFFSQGLKSNISQINKIPNISEAGKAKAMEMVFKFNEDILATPQAFETLMYQHQYLKAIRNNDREWLARNLPTGVYQTGRPNISYMKADEILGDQVNEGGISMTLGGNRQPFFARRTTTGEPYTMDPTRPIRTVRADIDFKGEGEIFDIEYFANTPESSLAIVSSLLDNFRKGNEAVRKLTTYSLSDLERKADVISLGGPGYLTMNEQQLLRNRPAGVARTQPNISTVISQGSEGIDPVTGAGGYIDDSPYGKATRAIAEGFRFEEGRAIPTETTAYQIPAARTSIQLQSDTDPESFLYTLVHESDHAQRLNYLDLLADAQFVEMHTNIVTYTNEFGVNEFAQGYNKRKDMFTERMNIVNTYKSDPRVVRAFREAYAKRVEELTAAGKPTPDFDDYLYNGLTETIMYLTEPGEQLARLKEMKAAYHFQIARPQGLRIEDWLGNVTPEMAEQAFNAWRSSGTSVGSDARAGMFQATNDIMLETFKGSTREEKFRNLASLMNITLTKIMPIAGPAAVAMQADIDPLGFSVSESTATPTPRPPLGLDRGGLVKKLVKKKRRGYRSV